VILTRHWVFVHMPKTGGSFVRKICRDHAPAQWQMSELHEHVMASDTPASHRHLPKFGFARNPLTWYVSWYHYFQKHPNLFFGEMSGDGNRPFDETLRTLFAHPVVQGTVEGGIPGGPLTQYLQRFFGPGLSLAQVFKVETLRADLLAFLRSHNGDDGQELPEPLETAICSQPTVNPSEHAPWRRYYDADLEAMVREREQPIFDHFGYD